MRVFSLIFSLVVCLGFFMLLSIPDPPEAEGAVVRRYYNPYGAAGSGGFYYNDTRWSQRRANRAIRDAQEKKQEEADALARQKAEQAKADENARLAKQAEEERVRKQQEEDAQRQQKIDAAQRQEQALYNEQDRRFANKRWDCVECATYETENLPGIAQDYVTRLPCDAMTHMIDAITYYQCGETWYYRGMAAGSTVFIMTQAPEGK